jgi:hypothetical protein
MAHGGILAAQMAVRQMLNDRGGHDGREPKDGAAQSRSSGEITCRTQQMQDKEISTRHVSFTTTHLTTHTHPAPPSLYACYARLRRAVAS